MFNAERGETGVEIDGASHRLRFTLGALAEIEQALGAADPAALSVRLQAINGQDLQRLLAALLRAGGADDADRLAARADPRRAAQAVASCFKANLT